MSREITGKEVKETLKKVGIDTRYISVRHKWCGYSDMWWIEIKSEAIDKQRVQRICRQFEEIDIDERTSEVLMGGNTYVNVDYCWDIRKKQYGIM